jgi:peptidoglycan L-alanyl-D-glutamate endopeptidase CwlK
MFVLGSTSANHLRGVHARLVNVVHLAMEITLQDFSVIEGVRSLEDEQENIRKGTSHLSDPRDCKHCLQKDGFGHAVDLAPYVDGKINWDWANIYPIAFAMKNASRTLGVRLRWGGCWDKCLNDLSDDIRKEHEQYAVRFPYGLMDGPHFEIAKSDQIYTYKNQPLTS